MKSDHFRIYMAAHIATVKYNDNLQSNVTMNFHK